MEQNNSKVDITSTENGLTIGDKSSLHTFKINDTPMTVIGEIDMKGSGDMIITIPKDSGKYSIDIHPID